MVQLPGNLVDPMNPTNQKTITAEDVLGEVTRLKIHGYRLVTLTAVTTGPDQVEILYHFDKDLNLVHLRLTTSPADAVPSISPVYLAAFLVENEIQDLFHIRFQDIVIDYDRKLFLTAETEDTPFCRHGTSETITSQSTDDHPEPSRGAP
jgi:ech hydrogenase subunit D